MSLFVVATLEQGLYMCCDRNYFHRVNSLKILQSCRYTSAGTVTNALQLVETYWVQISSDPFCTFKVPLSQFFRKFAKNSLMHKANK